MYKIWFERDVLAEYVPMFAAVAEGIGPGDQVARDPYHQLEMAHGVVAGGNYYNAAVMERAPNLLIISRTGIGFDRVDLEAATAHQIAVCNAPDAPTVPTAETALALMMSVARSLKQIENTMQSAIDSGSATNFWNVYVGIELSGKQLGLVGLGRIGGHVARVANALGMRVAAYDPYVRDERFRELGVERADIPGRTVGRIGCRFRARAAQPGDAQVYECRALRPNETRRHLRQCFTRTARR